MIDVDDSPVTPATVLARMVAAGISDERARRHLEQAAVVVDGQRVSDPEAPCPPGSRWVINPQ